MVLNRAPTRMFCRIRDFFGREIVLNCDSPKQSVTRSKRKSWMPRNNSIRGFVLFAIAVCLLLSAGPAAFAQDSIVDADELTFEEHIVPILQARCLKCHGTNKRESGLDLRRRFTMLHGGDSGPAVVPNKPEKSLIIESITDGLMPPEGEPALTELEIRVLKDWIRSGAALAGDIEQPLPTSSEPDQSFDERSRQHWAFQPVQTQSPPAVENDGWLRTPVDAFVLAGLEKQNLSPANPAAKSTLIRRLYFDLTGLPPAPAEVTAFINDDSRDAYEKVVDRLLADERYGERWAQHWLDVVRFAETEGFEYDRNVPDAWRFRDYVIDSLNSDKPFDQFVREQIAGDEIRPNDPELQAAAIFHRLGAVRRNAGNPDIALSRNEVLTERTNIVGEAFLGLTVGCARCHNHKLEPISQKDYYRLQAYFSATQEFDISLAPPAEKEALNQKITANKERISKLKAQASSATGEQKQQLEREIHDLLCECQIHLATIPSIRNDFEKRTAIHVLRRGVWEQKGVAVGPRPLSVLVSDTEPELAPDCKTPRTQLADWLTAKNNPLTARVIVNRIWQHHFGAGLVKTANDFGTHGSRPSHPELLDWLANELMRNEWRLKSLHRLLVLSNTYQQSSHGAHDSETTTADPENQYLSHFHRRRLSGEEIRDAILAITGRLNLKSHGPSVMIPVDRGLVNLLYDPAQWIVTKDAAEHDRRSIYLIAKRNLRLPFMETFDAPALQSSCPERVASTHAPQALELLNGSFTNEMADAFADRLTRECGDDPQQIIERAWQLATGHSPTVRERELAIEFLQDQPLREFALAIFNLNEFLYVL